MLRDRIRELFGKYDPEIQKLVSEVLDIEQENISYTLVTNSQALREIRQRIREIIDGMVKDEA
jgi:hypothetical protein